MKTKKIGMLIIAVIFVIGSVTVSVHAQDAAAGKAIYAQKCQTCHGADGSGNPGIAKALNVQLRPLGSEEVQKRTDADFKKIITDGNGKMKPVAGLNEKQVSDVVAHVRTLKK
jgi:mono/diheme cytochrome c family protein